MSIDLVKYNKFIETNNFLTPCQKKILKYLPTLKNKFYVPVKSNKQMYTYVTNAEKNQDILKIANLILLLKKFTSYENAINIVEQLKKKEISDIEIIKLIDDNKQLSRNPDDLYGICSSWKYILQILSHIIKNNQFYNYNINYKTKYLDIGCGSGYKTSMFGNYIGIYDKNIYGTDIKSWGPYAEKLHEKHNFNFKFIKDNNKLDYEDNSFDLVSCFLMLHHVKKIDVLLSEIKRILKPGGILLIIEHDSHNDFDNMILEILHTLFEYFSDGNKNVINEPNYSNYLNWCEWDFIFTEHSFSYIFGDYIFTTIEHNTRFDNIYYAFYKNNK